LLSRHVDWWEPGALTLATPALSDHSPHIFFSIRIDQISGREGSRPGGS
jgi:nitroimidazol reductase NimA-like FMN-containing flavoprotein (pyridoxamine 5'-phosphate oxidase superfamily)